MMKGTHFSSLKEIKDSVTKKLKRLKDFTSAFVGGRIACKSALTRRGSTLNRTIHEVSKNAVLKFLSQQSGFFFVTPCIVNQL